MTEEKPLRRKVMYKDLSPIMKMGMSYAIFNVFFALAILIFYIVLLILIGLGLF